MKYFRKQKWRTRSNVMNQRKTLEIMWVNVKVGEKEEKRLLSKN